MRFDRLDADAQQKHDLFGAFVLSDQLQDFALTSRIRAATDQRFEFRAT
jgi:hypothetical protein